MGLNPGTALKSINNANIVIEEELGEGGQGVVYKVTYNGKPKALKVYKQGVFIDEQAFYKNLSENVKKGRPAENFLWPDDMLPWIDTPDGKTFGYIMDLRPSGFIELSEFLAGAAKFPSFKSRIIAALKICTAFWILHSNGYSYQDLNDGNFFINPQTGNVLICDNDNVAPNKTYTGILGKPRYMAPEIVRGESMPNTHTDRFSLGVIIFLLLTQTHPFEGATFVLLSCLTEEAEKHIYGVDPVFIMHPTDKRNKPLRNIHTNILTLWPEFPNYLKEAFIKAYTGESLMNPNRRMTEQQWERILIHFYSDIFRCSCGNETFIWDKNAPRCSGCGQVFNKFQMLKISTCEYEIPLLEGNIVFREQLGTANIGEGTKAVIRIVRNPQDRKLYLQNLTGHKILCITPSGRQVQVEHQETAPANVGLGFKIDSSMITVTE